MLKKNIIFRNKAKITEIDFVKNGNAVKWIIGDILDSLYYFSEESLENSYDLFKMFNFETMDFSKALLVTFTELGRVK